MRCPQRCVVRARRQTAQPSRAARQCTEHAIKQRIALRCTCISFCKSRAHIHTPSAQRKPLQCAALRKACPHAHMSAHPRRLRRISLNRRRALRGSLIRDYAHCALQRSRGSQKCCARKFRSAARPHVCQRLPPARARMRLARVAKNLRDGHVSNAHPCGAGPTASELAAVTFAASFFSESTRSVSETRPQRIVKLDNGG